MQTICSVDEIKNFKGKISGKEVDRLHWLGTQVPENGTVVELGPYAGMSTASILSGMPASAIMTTVDIWLLDEDYKEKRILDTHVVQTGAWNDRLIRIVSDARLLAKVWTKPIDLLFVDTAKDYETINAIWKAWLPFCRGWVASHDFKYNRERYTGVVDTVTELCFPITEQHHHVDFTWSGKIK